MSESPRPKQGLRPAKAAKKLDVSLPTLWRYARLNPAFPKAKKLSARVTIFDEGELDAFMSADAK